MLRSRVTAPCKAFGSSKQAPRSVAAHSTASRRQVLEGAALVAAGLVVPGSALAKIPKGYVAVKDAGDGYEFMYPFGWQEVSVKGVDAVYKDVIEPLESVSVQVVPTDKTTIVEFGPASEIGFTIADTILTGPGQEVTMVSSTAENYDDRDYVAFEFIAKSKRYSRHTLGVATVANGKLMLLSTGSGEKRWRSMKDKLESTAKSFRAFTVY